MGSSENKIPIVTGLSDSTGIGVWSIYRIAPVLRAGQRDELLRWISERLGGTDRILGREQVFVECEQHTTWPESLKNFPCSFGVPEVV